MSTWRRCRGAKFWTSSSRIRRWGGSKSTRDTYSIIFGAGRDVFEPIRHHLGDDYASGGIECWEVERDGKPAIEFSWDGNDEMYPVQGRGWAVLDGDEIEGRIFIHRGDDSAFRAVRKGR